MIETFKSVIGDNQFLSGGFVLMLLGSLLALCRNLPFHLWTFLKRKFVISIEIRNENAIFFWFEEWLFKQGIGERSHDFVVNDKLEFSPAPGVHFAWYCGYLMRITRTRSEGSARGVDGGAFFSTKAPENFVVQFLFCRDRDAVRRLMDEVKQIGAYDTSDTIQVFTSSNCCWYARRAQRRPAVSVVSDNDFLLEIIRECRWFFGNKSWYVDRGMPHRRGYLLHGPPGNGKTSIIRAVATELNLPVYVVNPASVSSDSELNQLMFGMDTPCIMVVEDVDCCVEGREVDGNKISKITFSGLLNAIDGLQSNESRILFLTTNFPDNLDAALLRPGRVDRKFYVGNATHDQARKLMRRFLPDAPVSLEESFVAMANGTKSMAYLQEHLITSCDEVKRTQFGEALADDS